MICVIYLFQILHLILTNLKLKQQLLNLVLVMMQMVNHYSSIQQWKFRNVNLK